MAADGVEDGEHHLGRGAAREGKEQHHSRGKGKELFASPSSNSAGNGRSTPNTTVVNKSEFQIESSFRIADDYESDSSHGSPVYAKSRDNNSNDEGDGRSPGHAPVQPRRGSLRH